MAFTLHLALWFNSKKAVCKCEAWPALFYSIQKCFTIGRHSVCPEGFVFLSEMRETESVQLTC